MAVPESIPCRMRYGLRSVAGMAVLMFLAACAGPPGRNSEPRLFLLSRGLVTDTLRSALLAFIGGDPATMRVAVVANATRSVSKQEKKVRRVKERMASIGFDSARIDRIDIRDGDPRRLEDYDLVYVLGGNPFVLLADIRASGADRVLSRMTRAGKPVMGYSAGALLLGPDLLLMQAVDSLLGFNEEGLKDLSCLHLYDFRIFPHYSEFSADIEGLAAVIEAFEDTSRVPVIRLNDNQAFIMGSGPSRIIGR